MSHTEPPIWLLDVDGPINANRSGWSAAPFNATVQGFKLRWSPALIDRIRRVHARGQAEIWWCTTWCPYADLLENLWQLPVFPRALPDEVCFAGGSLCLTAKNDAAHAVIAAGRRLIWTDDQIDSLAEAAFEEEAAAGRALLIAPSPSRGLRAEHLDAIEAFCGPGSGTPIRVGDRAAREISLWLPAGR